MVYSESLHYLLYSCSNFIFGKKCGSWDRGQNAFDQSICRILKLTIALKQIDKKGWIFACCYRFMKIKILLKNIGVGMIKNGCGHSGRGTLKLTVSQEAIKIVINWFLVRWYKLRKAKSFFNNFWVVVVKNGQDLVDHGTLKSGVYYKWLMNWADWLNDFCMLIMLE